MGTGGAGLALIQCLRRLREAIPAGPLGIYDTGMNSALVFHVTMRWTEPLVVRHRLLSELIVLAVDHHSPDRLDLAIDILPQLGDRLFEYAHTFLIRDVDRWNHVYSSRVYEPDDDYWYVLLRSVGQADIAEATKLMFITSCLIESNRGIAEAAVEALGDINSGAARDALHRLTDEQDRFIAELAQNALDE